MAKSNHSKSAKALNPTAKKAVSASVADLAKKLAASINKRLTEKEEIKRTTVGVFALKANEVDLFGAPFIAPTAESALLAQKELLPQSNLFLIGEFCFLTGELKTINHKLILDN